MYQLFDGSRCHSIKVMTRTGSGTDRRTDRLDRHTIIGPVIDKRIKINRKSNKPLLSIIVTSGRAANLSKERKIDNGEIEAILFVISDTLLN
jgi:hypothetical protein